MGERGEFPLCLRVVLPAGLACDGMPTYTRFISVAREDDELMSSGQILLSMTIKLMKWYHRMIALVVSDTWWIVDIRLCRDTVSLWFQLWCHQTVVYSCFLFVLAITRYHSLL